MISCNLVDDSIWLEVHFSKILHATFIQLRRVVSSFGMLVQAQYQRIELFKYTPGIINRVFSGNVLEQVDQIILSLSGEANMVAFNSPCP